MQKSLTAALFFLCSCAVQAQSGTAAVKMYVRQQAVPILTEFERLLSIPSVASEPAGLRQTAAFIQQMMKDRGLSNIQLLEADTDSVPPVVYGEVMVPGANKTLLFYAHYDGQPVNPAQWAEGLDPFKAVTYSDRIDEGGTKISWIANGIVEDDWRIYARGASDDKAGVAVILNAYSALIQSGQQPTCNLKFFFEGEEEQGSIHLAEILKKYKPLLSSDGWIICDGPVHQSGYKQIVFGVRGDAHLDLTVYGPKRPLHSGHYGNWVPNPALRLATLLASMKNEQGRVTVNGFYDDVIPLTASEKKALAAIPPVEEQIKKELGIRMPEQPMSLGLAISEPSLNINGMRSGNVGAMASNQIPTYATAVLDLRLVLGNDWQRQQQKVIEHIKSQGYYVIDHEPSEEERMAHDKLIRVIAGTDGYNAQRTPMDLPFAKSVIEAVKTSTTDPVVLQPRSGGSLPLFMIEQILSTKTISVPIANHDNNQHAENENIRLGNFLDGIETMAAIMQLK